MGVRSKFIWLSITAALFAISTMASEASAQKAQLTLEECIDIALKQNADVISQKNRVETAKWNLWEAWGDVLPSVGASADYTFSKTFGPQFIQLPDTAYIGTDPGSKRYSTGLGISFTIFDGGATWLNVRGAAKRKASAKSDYENTVANVAYNTKIAYFNLLTAKMLRDVQEAALKRSKKQLEIVASRYELGSAALSERLKAEVNVARDSLNLLQRENEIRVAEFNLNVLMNRDASIPITTLDTLKPVDLSMSLDDYVSQSLNSNPGIRKLEFDLEDANNSVWIARSRWLPNVSASLGWGWNPDDVNNWFSYNYNEASYRFNISISYNLFDAFRKKTQPAKAKLAAVSLEEVLEQQRHALLADVRSAFLDFEKSSLQLEVARLAERSAEEDLRLQQERYRLGASSILELLDAQVSLTDAQYSRVLALFELNRSAAALARTLGER